MRCALYWHPSLSPPTVWISVAGGPPMCTPPIPPAWRWSCAYRDGGLKHEDSGNCDRVCLTSENACISQPYTVCGCCVAGRDSTGTPCARVVVEDAARGVFAEVDRRDTGAPRSSMSGPAPGPLFRAPRGNSLTGSRSVAEKVNGFLRSGNRTVNRWSGAVPTTATTTAAPPPSLSASRRTVTRSSTPK